MTEISDLSHEDQVALWAGRVVRREAQIESMLRTLYYQLSGEGLSWAVVPEQFAAVSRDVRKMLKAADVDADYLGDCLAALDRLGVAHSLRNRIVHDQWVQQDPGSFVSAPKGVSGPSTKPDVVWDVSEFERCYTELTFCFAQISGMFWSLACFVGDHRDIWREMLPSNRESLAGRIKITGEGTWEFTDPVFIAEEHQRSAARLAEFQTRVEHLKDGNSPT